MNTETKPSSAANSPAHKRQYHWSPFCSLGFHIWETTNAEVIRFPRTQRFLCVIAEQECVLCPKTRRTTLAASTRDFIAD